MEEYHSDKSSRILLLYTKLLHGQLLKKNELAEYFGVNEKSIQRDLETIRDFLDEIRQKDGCGCQLVYDHQKKGYFLEDNELSQLSTEEMIAVGKILLDSRAFTKKEMNRILDKLVSGCIPKENHKFINELLSNERFHYVEPRHQRNFLDKLVPLGKAIRECRVIRIQYRKLRGQAVVERKLEPLAILFSEYYFYLVGFIEEIDRSEAFENENDPFPTIYRIDRIEEMEVLDKHFHVPYKDRFEEGEFRKRVQFMYGGRLQKVKFWYSGESVEAVLDRLPTAKVLDEKDGAYLIEAEVFGKGIDMWMRSQGDAIRDYVLK